MNKEDIVKTKYEFILLDDTKTQTTRVKKKKKTMFEFQCCFSRGWRLRGGVRRNDNRHAPETDIIDTLPHMLEKAKLIQVRPVCSDVGS